MITLVWEVPLDIDIAYPSLHNVSCGDDSDICIGFSEVTQEANITGWSYDGHQLFVLQNYTVLDTRDFCKINGTIRNPWAKSKPIRRIDLYSDNLSSNTNIYTNSKGEFYFVAVPGERMKIRLPDETSYWWVAIPDKTKLTWEELKTYGYQVD